MQPRPRAETSRLLFPNLRFCMRPVDAKYRPWEQTMRDDKRPYVICHMLPSIDGRIVARGWDVKNATRQYERTAATFDADAWIIGRVSMEPYAREARCAYGNAGSYAIAIDPSGKLKWRGNDIDGERVITVLTKS